MDQNWLNELKTLAQNNRIAAIHRYREHTHVGLKEAKDAIQTLMEPPSTPITTPPMPKEIIHLLSLGQKIEAIKHYRELTGLGLKEAKEAMDAIELKRS